MAIVRNPATGKIIAKRFSLNQLAHAADNDGGFCLACGAEAYGVEPDARKYRCDSCALHTVYGAEEIALMGFVEEAA